MTMRDEKKNVNNMQVRKFYESFARFVSYLVETSMKPYNRRIATIRERVHASRLFRGHHGDEL